MKYWNKRKQVRQKHWTCVKLRIDDRDRYFTGPYEGWITHSEFNKIKSELQRSPSNNKFYMQIMKKEVWFESAKDATWFTLKYAGIHL